MILEAKKKFPSESDQIYLRAKSRIIRIISFFPRVPRLGIVGKLVIPFRAIYQKLHGKKNKIIKEKPENELKKLSVDRWIRLYRILTLLKKKKKFELRR